ncbi:hypothetical protein M758_UG223700 [Ceratodon purpureus]|nr:hypothetical protein M758_UG223700 [Ceratodon purpureus]
MPAADKSTHSTRPADKWDWLTSGSAFTEIWMTMGLHRMHIGAIYCLFGAVIKPINALPDLNKGPWPQQRNSPRLLLHSYARLPLLPSRLDLAAHNLSPLPQPWLSVNKITRSTKPSTSPAGNLSNGIDRMIQSLAEGKRYTDLMYWHKNKNYYFISFIWNR